MLKYCLAVLETILGGRFLYGLKWPFLQQEGRVVTYCGAKMRLGIIGILGFALLVAGCVAGDQSKQGVGFGNYQTYPGNNGKPDNNRVMQPPVASPSYGQGTGIAAGGGLPVYRYSGRNADKLHIYQAAQAALWVNNRGGMGLAQHEKTHAPVILAGRKMLAQQVYVGSHHFVVIRLRTFKEYMFGPGGGKKTLRKIMEDVAKLTGCSANKGIYTGTQGYAVPIECS